MKSLKQQAIEAPKYTFYLKGYGFVSNNQGLRGIVFTMDINKAENYAEGFDNFEVKQGYWNAIARLHLKDKTLTFKKINI